MHRFRGPAGDSELLRLALVRGLAVQGEAK
jgi:hypothetical protein